LRKAAATTPEVQADGEDDANADEAPAEEVAPAAVPEHAEETAAAAEEMTPEVQADGEDDANADEAPAEEVAPAAVPEHAEETAAAAEEMTPEVRVHPQPPESPRGLQRRAFR
jgi:hypothetical protein